MEKASTRAHDVIGQVTANPNRLEAYITLEEGYLYVHSNFHMPGAKYETKLATDEQFTLPTLAYNLVGAKKGGVFRTQRAFFRVYEKDMKFFVDERVMTSKYGRKLDLSSAGNVIIVGRDGKQRPLRVTLLPKTGPGSVASLREAPSALREPNVKRPKVSGIAERARTEGTPGAAARRDPPEFRASRDGPAVVVAGAGSADLGTLRVEPRANGFAVRMQARESDRAYALARKASASMNPPSALARDAAVEVVLVLPGGSYLVGVRGIARFLRLKPSEGGKKKFEPTWVERQVLLDSLGECEYLKVDLSSPADQRIVIDARARGPPEGSRAVVVVNGSDKISGVAEVKGDSVSIVVRRKDLKALAETPETLTRLFRSVDPVALRAALAKPGSIPSVGRADPVAADKPPLIAHLEAGRMREASEILARDYPSARKVLDTDLAERLPVIDRYLEQGRYSEALSLLETAAKVHRDNPRLLLCRGLAEVGRGRPAGAAEALNRALARKADPQVMLNEISRRLQNASLKPEQREFLLQQSRMLVARDFKARKKTAADVQLVVKGDKLEQKTLLAAAPELKRVDAAKLEPDSRLLLDDSAGLNNRDWSPAARQQTLQQALKGGVELYEVLRPDPVLKTHLSGAVQFGKGRRRIRLTDAFGKTLALGLAGALAKLSYAPSKDDEEEYSEEDFQDSKASPLTPKARRAKKPVYLLLKKAQP